MVSYQQEVQTVVVEGGGGLPEPLQESYRLPAEVSAALWVQRRSSDSLVERLLELRTRLSSDWNLDMIGNVRSRPSGPH